MVNIKEATIDDLKAISEMNLDLFKFETQFGNTYSLEWTFSENAGQKYFRYRIEEDENGIVFVAFSDNVPVGYICGCKFRHKARTKQNMAEIENMFVEGNFRNQGVGKLLIDAFFRESKKARCREVKGWSHI